MGSQLMPMVRGIKSAKAQGTSTMTVYEAGRWARTCHV